MPTQIVTDEYERKMLIKRMQEQKLPFSVSISKGKSRTWRQNRLNRQWCNEISEQLGDQTPEEVRGLLKLQFGVPILRAENEAFCERYDAVVKPLPYATKLALMQEPLDFPITRLMTTAQQTKYTDQIYAFFTAKGVILTVPDDRRFGPSER